MLGWLVQGNVLEWNKPWIVSLALVRVMGISQNQIAPSYEEIGPRSDCWDSWLSPLRCHHHFILDVLGLWIFLMLSLSSGQDSRDNYPCPDNFFYSYNGTFNSFCWLEKHLCGSQHAGTECLPSSEVIQADTWFLKQPLFTQACICTAWCL